MVVLVKNLPANLGDKRGATSTPGSGSSPRGWNDNLLQYSCLEKPMDREVWEDMIPRIGHKELDTIERLN